MMRRKLQFAVMIQSHELLVDGIIGFVYGVSLPSECMDEECCKMQYIVAANVI
jgi:hypothetical protein